MLSYNNDYFYEKGKGGGAGNDGEDDFWYGSVKGVGDNLGGGGGGQYKSYIDSM